MLPEKKPFWKKKRKKKNAAAVPPLKWITRTLVVLPFKGKINEESSGGEDNNSRVLGKGKMETI